MKVGKSIVFDGKMGIRKFWSVALPFSKVVCAVKVYSSYSYYRVYLRVRINPLDDCLIVLRL